MKTPKHPLRKIVSYLNTLLKMAAFGCQIFNAHLFWSEDQIFRFCDIIMREYPIPNFAYPHIAHADKMNF